MEQFAQAKTLFGDDFDMSGYLDSFTFEAAKNGLLQTLNSRDIPMVFLLGDPGVGKSYLLQFVIEKATRIKIAKFFPNPHFNERELLETLLRTTGEEVQHNTQSIHDLIESLKKHYQNLEYTVFIDEAQLMSEKQLEFIRVLGDMKLFQFVLSMHKNEGHYILAKPHFKSRNAKTITLEHITKEELTHYLQNRLLAHNLSEVATQFNEKEAQFIHKHSKGNFRSSKKMMRAVCEIIELAKRGNLEKYTKVNEATLTMAAIDVGAIHVK